MVEKIVLSVSQTTSARNVISRAGCLLSAKICVMPFRTSVTERNQQLISYLKIRTDRIPSSVKEFFLDISKEEMYEGKLLTN
jgi:hypothetical protein